MSKLEGKVAIVTGGTSGIGKAIAERFLKEGAKVIVSGRNAKEPIPGTLFIATDVQIDAEIRSLIEQTVAKFGRIDILVNCAAVVDGNLEANLQTVEEGYIQKALATNFLSAVYATQAAILELIKTRGTIINIGSRLGLEPSANLPIYSSTKAALIAFTTSSALAYAKVGVRVNCVCPSMIDAPLLYQAYTDEQRYKKYTDSNPMGRLGKPEEVANVVAFLASSESSYVTGSVYTVDGGSSKLYLS